MHVDDPNDDAELYSAEALAERDGAVADGTTTDDAGKEGDDTTGKEGDGKEGDDKTGKEGDDKEGDGKEGDDSDDGVEIEGVERNPDGTFKAGNVRALSHARRKALEQRDIARMEAETLRKQLEALQSGGKPPKADDPPQKTVADRRAEINAALDTLQIEVEELRADAMTVDAAKKQREIDKLNRELLGMDNDERIQRNNAQLEFANDNDRYNGYVSALLTAAPELDKTSDDYDPVVAKELNDLAAAYEHGPSKLKGSHALRKAAILLLKVDPAEPTKPAASAKPPAKPDKGARQDVTERAVDLSKKNPPDLSNRGRGEDAPTLDVNRLTDEEFANIPEAKLLAMRDGV